MVSPLTAGGIHSALDVGRSAGVAIENHLHDGGSDPGAKIARELPTYFWKGMMRRAFDLNPPNAIYDRLLGSRVLRDVAQSVFFHHRGLFSLDAWKEIVFQAGRSKRGELDDRKIA